MIRRLRQRHFLAAHALLPLGLLGFAWATWAGPRVTVADRLAWETAGNFSGDVMRVAVESNLGRLEVVLSLDTDRGTIRVLDDAGTTYADVLAYWSATVEAERLPPDARLIGTLGELVRAERAIPGRGGALHFFSLAHGTLAASYPLAGH